MYIIRQASMTTTTTTRKVPDGLAPLLVRGFGTKRWLLLPELL